MNKDYAKRMFDKGFHSLIDRLFDRLKPEQITGIKPKYGRIDLYVDGTDEEQDFAYEIERESERTCEMCGKPGELKDESGWITALCDECYNKRSMTNKNEQLAEYLLKNKNLRVWQNIRNWSKYNFIYGSMAGLEDNMNKLIGLEDTFYKE